MTCCYGEVFNERSARRAARRYREKGLNETERHVVEYLSGRADTVLDVGGGVGAIELELLKAGASRAVNAELSPAYETEARALAEEAGVGDRVEFVVKNLVDTSEAPADAVVMHRVVCCFPEGELLVRRGAAHARRYLVVTFPRESAPLGMGFALLNLGLWLMRRRFRVYLHPVARLLASADGMTLSDRRRAGIWETVVLERPA